MLAVIGLGSIGSMALWQASRLSDSVTGFEAASPPTAVAPGAATPACCACSTAATPTTTHDPSRAWTSSGPSVSAHDAGLLTLSFDY